VSWSHCALFRDATNKATGSFPPLEGVGSKLYMKEAHREVTGDGDRQTSILHPVDNMVMSKKEKAMAGSNTSTPVSAATSEREKAIEQALSQIERRFGKGAIMRLGEQAKVQIDVIPTGSIALDLALGVGGIPRGRITEIYGPESSGKTTLCQHVIANAQRAGGYAAFIDAEHALDRTYAARCGVDVNNLLISQPDTGEQALEILDALVRSNAIDVVVVDSVAALTPRAEIEGEMGDSHVGLQARLMSQAMRKLAGAISASNTAVLFTNQLREKVGVMFGNPETTSGGKALKFYASVRLDIRRTDTIKQGQDAMGSRTRVRVVKNKVAPPFRVAEFDIMYSEGISREGGLIDLGLEMGLVKKSGAWFNVGDIRLGQGRENAKDFLRQNSDVAQALEEQIRGNIASFKPAEIDLGDDDSGGEEEI
jgi:recombination protein RecA